MYRKGSITVFFSLILFMVTSLLLGMVEAVRIYVVHAGMEGAVNTAVHTTFSYYLPPLFQEYGVLFLDKDSLELEQLVKESLLENLETNMGGKSQLSDVTISDIIYSTDDNGEVFARQVLEYMKYALPKDAIESLLEQCNLLKAGEGNQSFLEDIEEDSEALQDLEKELKEVEKSLEALKKVKGDPKQILAAMKKNAEKGEKKAWKKNFKTLKKVSKKLKKKSKSLRKTIEKYEKTLAKAEQEMKALKKKVEGKKSEYTAEEYKQVSEELKELENGVIAAKQDTYGVRKVEEQVKNYQMVWDALGDFIQTTSRRLSDKNQSLYYEKVKDIHNQYQQVQMETLILRLEQKEVEKEENNVIEFIQDLMEDASLSLVVEDVSKVSNSSISLNNLPSHTVDYKQKRGKLDKNKILYGQYVLTHFGNYNQKIENHVLQYEVEYILKGKKKDKDNLSAVAYELVGIRTGLNLMYLYTDAAKKASAYELAVALTGFTGMPVLIEITKHLLLGAWASGEAIVDVRDLLAGKKVEIMKTKKNWNLSLSGLWNLSKKESQNSGKKGIKYEDYLRVLLSAQKKSEQYFRTMDLIQANIQAQGNAGFQMKTCCSGFTVEAMFLADKVFSNAFLTDSLYRFSIERAYAY